MARLDVIGAVNFARTMLLPHLKGQIPFGTVVNQTALSANHVKTKFGFHFAEADPGELFSDPTPAALLIATRHHLHGPFVETALESDRHIFVEKPLCLSAQELARIDTALSKSQGTVQVGFNRRFAPASLDLKRRLAASPGPKSATYRVIPGKLDPQHWYANYAESGGRVLGEACHFLDYFCFLFEAKPVRVFAQTTWPAAGRLPFPDSVAAQVDFSDGSCGQLIYTAEGDSSFPKESLTIFASIREERKPPLPTIQKATPSKWLLGLRSFAAKPITLCPTSKPAPACCSPSPSWNPSRKRPPSKSPPDAAASPQLRMIEIRSSAIRNPNPAFFANLSQGLSGC